MQFRDRTPYTDNPVTDTEVAEDDLRILSNDQVLSGQWELVEVHEQKIDELVKETQPEALGFAEASIDHFRLGRTDIGSNQGNAKEMSTGYFHISRSSMMIRYHAIIRN